ncbi:MAG: hypothetical protein JWP06_1120 [Candidatus Saccharibacteria bacterium]|nr:hypothetical protein [Candidatus Saccharibacteria bacterium]
MDIYFLGGEGGIRTLGTLRFTAFRERPVQPLLHLSVELPTNCNKNAKIPLWKILFLAKSYVVIF